MFIQLFIYAVYFAMVVSTLGSFLLVAYVQTKAKFLNAGLVFYFSYGTMTLQAVFVGLSCLTIDQLGGF